MGESHALLNGVYYYCYLYYLKTQNKKLAHNENERTENGQRVKENNKLLVSASVHHSLLFRSNLKKKIDLFLLIY